MAALFGWTSLNTGEILRKELVKTSDAGKIVAESFEKHEYVPDDVVIDLVKKEIHKCEKENQSWIIQGFPRTKN
jgi:adenylate kinase family enzyme